MSAIKNWITEREQALADITALIARQETDPIAIKAFNAEMDALLDRLYEIDNPKETK